jgi:hypothetical protein
LPKLELKPIKTWTYILFPLYLVLCFVVSLQLQQSKARVFLFVFFLLFALLLALYTINSLAEKVRLFDTHIEYKTLFQNKSILFSEISAIFVEISMPSEPDQEEESETVRSRRAAFLSFYRGQMSVLKLPLTLFSTISDTVEFFRLIQCGNEGILFDETSKCLAQGTLLPELI